MDQNRRILLFIVVTAAFWYVWFGWVQPKFFPLPPPQNAQQAADVGDEDLLGGEDNAALGNAEAAAENAIAEEEWQEPENPNTDVVLGSIDPGSGYFQQVFLTSEGAAVTRLELNDARYRNLENRKNALALIETDADSPKVFESNVAAVNAQLAKFKTDTTQVDWKVERRIPDEKDNKLTRGVVFSLDSPDGNLQLLKTFTLRKPEGAGNAEVRDENHAGYMLDFEFGVRNLSDQQQKVTYTLQGPLGLPLENEEHTSFFRNLELGFIDSDGDLDASTLTAADVAEQAEAVQASRTARVAAEAADRRVQQLKARYAQREAESKAAPSDEKLKAELRSIRDELAVAEREADNRGAAALSAAKAAEEWKTPFRYLGVEVQYFTSLLFPDDDRPVEERFKAPRVAFAVPDLIGKTEKPSNSNISFELQTEPVAVPAGGEVSQKWSLYTGPKRKSLLNPLGATAVLDQGRFLWMENVSWVAGISGAMLWIMGKLHAVGIPYGIAIICLTVIVRSAMFPLSRKQAIAAAKMKELQPKLNELKTRFGNDREGMAKAQMELFAKHGYNPLGGCLPVFLQLPIFIGLYNALQSSVDLRMAEFLWIDNLAAPDQLFRMPFSLPFIGFDFNLLPLITVALFYVQQKLFMPPATTPEQEMQFRMMNFMMLFMGFFFYHVPAGLCVYFIASSTWSICERKLLEKTKAAHVTAAEAAEVDREVEDLSPKSKGGRGKTTLTPAPDRKKTWLERLMEAADQAKREAETGKSPGRPNNKPGGGKSKSKTRP